MGVCLVTHLGRAPQGHLSSFPPAACFVIHCDSAVTGEARCPFLCGIAAWPERALLAVCHSLGGSSLCPGRRLRSRRPAESSVHQPWPVAPLTGCLDRGQVAGAVQAPLQLRDSRPPLAAGGQCACGHGARGPPLGVSPPLRSRSHLTVLRGPSSACPVYFTSKFSAASALLFPAVFLPSRCVEDTGNRERAPRLRR